MEAHESTRKRLESTLPKDHEDHNAERRFSSMSHYNLVHKLDPMTQPMKIPDAKAAVDKESEKLEKLPAWQLNTVKSKKEVIFWEHKEREKNTTLLHWWTFAISKNAESEPKYQKYKGRVVLRGDIVKVFAEQGSSASQMTAAVVMGVIARLPDCAGQAADAVSAHTQVQMKDAPKFSQNPKSECPDVWIRLPRHKWPKSWSIIEDPVGPLERNLYGHPLAGLLWGRQFEEVLTGLGWGKSTGLGMSVVHRKQ